MQNIRESNFVLTYGPGAIVETKRGARLIPMPDRYGFLSKNGVSSALLKRYEITDTRMSSVIRTIINRNEVVHIFRLPSNSDDFPTMFDNIVYGTHIFPRYFICHNSKGHRKKGYEEEFVLFYASSPDARCPVCGETADSKHVSQVRFIMACPKGHMDEVNWNEAVHGDKSCGKSPAKMWFYWIPRGSTLDGIVIRCPDPECGAEVTMGEIYRKSFKCTGRLPERDEPEYGKNLPPPPYLTHPTHTEKCNEHMKVIQRQSSALRIPITISLLTIPKLDTRIAELLQIPAIRHTVEFVMDDMNLGDKKFISTLEKKLEIPVKNGELSPELKEEFINILRNNKSELLENGDLRNLMEKLYADIGSNNHKVSFMEYIYEEFESLMEAARKGPPVSEKGNFAIGPRTTVASTEHTPELDVYPVEKLRTVTAQIGYIRSIYNRRGGPQNGPDDEGWGLPKPRYIGYRDGYSGEVWYPGYVGSGEGIFITFHNSEDINNLLKKREGVRNMWLNDKYHESYKRISLWSEIAYKPIFVWLHTLSHSIMKTIYMTSGYSMASIRERIYLSRDQKNGGILLYTTSPSSDGAMGGLVSMVNKMNDIVRSAIDSLRVCSNDPLCITVQKKPESPNGAACYSCLFVSETSCEHGNRWLDRHIILG